MASYLFRNVKTQETKVVNSKDSTTAKRVYSNKTWEYVKAVPQQKTVKNNTQKPNRELYMLSLQLGSAVVRLRDEANEYDCRFAQNRANELEDLVCKLQSILRK